jgi:ABC-type spermidine/putrescine transport system permease subunit II
MRWTHHILAAHAALAYAFLYAPIAVLVVFSFNAGRQAAVWRGFSLKWYAALADNRPLRDAAVNSLIVAGAATVLATTIGTLAAVGLSAVPVPRAGRSPAGCSTCRSSSPRSSSACRS